jgi:transposase-like protein
METPLDPRYAGHRYPAEVICYAVWLYFRFPLSLRMVEAILAARGISVTYETIRQWGGPAASSGAGLPVVLKRSKSVAVNRLAAQVRMVLGRQHFRGRRGGLHSPYAG